MPLPSFLRKGTTQTHVNNNSQIFVFSSFLHPRALVRQPPDGQGRGDHGSYLCVAFSSFNLMVLGLSFSFFRLLHSFWINFAHIPLAGLPDSFLYYGALLKNSSCCVFCHMPLDLSGVYHFLIIYFYLFIFFFVYPSSKKGGRLISTKLVLAGKQSP